MLGSESLQRAGIVQRNSSVPSSARTASSGVQLPIRNWCETIRVPGRSSRLSLGSSCLLTLADKYNVTTVASEMSV